MSITIKLNDLVSTISKKINGKYCISIRKFAKMSTSVSNERYSRFEVIVALILANLEFGALLLYSYN